MAEQPTRIMIGPLQGYDHEYAVGCGCLLEYRGDVATFSYCPMHQAAPATLAALERNQWLEGDYNVWTGRPGTPQCGECNRFKQQGHMENCSIGNAIAAAR